MITNTVCFIGHRKISITDELVLRLTNIIEGLILAGVSTFLFGSKSEFDTLCHKIVSDLREKYPHIKRISYTCTSEACTFENERAKLEKTFSNVLNKEVHILGVEEEVEHKTKYVAGKASYVERNQAMIDNSDIVIFYYDKDYKPPERKHSNRGFFYQPNSGTAIAYTYAKQKKKKIINLFEELNNSLD